MVNFSEKELSILKDKDLLLLKQGISSKIITLLAEVERDLHHEIQNLDFKFPANTFIQSGKISKGENYLGLPYFMLDFPRLFTQREVFAFRTLLWWGNELSCTLHLAGTSLLPYLDFLPGKLAGEKDLYISVNSTAWEFHFGRDNFLPAVELSENDIRNQMDQFHFIKMANLLPLDKQELFKPFILESLARFLKYLRPV